MLVPQESSLTEQKGNSCFFQYLLNSSLSNELLAIFSFVGLPPQSSAKMNESGFGGKVNDDLLDSSSFGPAKPLLSRNW